MATTEAKRQSEITISALAIAGVRFITPLLVAVLVYIGTQTLNTLEKLGSTIQQIQITMASEQATRASESIEIKAALSDHEGRIRHLENKK